MKLWFYVEGQTEEMFINRVLRGHLMGAGVQVGGPILAATGSDGLNTLVGGSSNTAAVNEDLKTLLGNEIGHDDRLTTFFDLYGLPADFPGRAEAEHLGLAGVAKADHPEASWQETIADARFDPYLQVFEFEALLLADLPALHAFYGPDAHGIPALAAGITGRLPEDIDDGPTTSPAKRLQAAITGFRKTESWRILQSVGLPRLRKACPRFGQWLTRCEAGML